jgi:single-strand DNA-binding protein
MNNLNSLIIEGNLVRDPMYRETAKGTPMSTFSFASNRFYKRDESMEKEVSYFDVESWGKVAEMVNNLGHKGRGVRVVGRLKQDRWQDKEGKNQSRTVIVAEHVEFRAEVKEKAEEAADDESFAAGF